MVTEKSLAEIFVSLNDLLITFSLSLLDVAYPLDPPFSSTEVLANRRDLTENYWSPPLLIHESLLVNNGYITLYGGRRVPL